MGRPVAARGEGRERTIAAALKLFAEHGVSGTSLADIAAELGVTKAAVYFQFHTKEEIVLEVLRPGFEVLQALLITAEAQPTDAECLACLIEGLVDLAVSHRTMPVLMHGDRAAARIVREHPTLQGLLDRLNALLHGEHATAAERVAISMMGGGVMLAGIDPHLASLDDETLRTELLRHARVLLADRLRAPRSRRP